MVPRLFLKVFITSIHLPSFFARWEGIFVGSDLNNGEWQSVLLTVNETHVFLAANDQTTLHPINPVQTINSSDTSFSTTYIGEATVYVFIWLLFVWGAL